MFMNFMDYADDIAYANFTPDQATIMQACFAPGGPLELLNQQLTCNANAGPDITVCGLTANVVATENIGDVNTHWLPNAGFSFIDIKTDCYDENELGSNPFLSAIRANNRF